MPLRYAASLMTPAGRLPKGAFVLLSIGLMIGHMLVFRKAMAGGPTSGSYMVALLAFSWMTFCVTCRRVRELGGTGFALVPCALAAVAVMLVCYDPTLVEAGTDAHGAARIKVLRTHGINILRGLYVVLFLFLARTRALVPGTDHSAPYFSDRARLSRDAISRLDQLGQLTPTVIAESVPAAAAVLPRRPSLGKVPPLKPFSKRG